MDLLTGASGLLGSHLLLELLKDNQRKIRILLRNENSLKKLKRFFKLYNRDFSHFASNIEIVYGDMTDGFLIDQITENIENVYHTAALVSFYNKDKKKMWNINVLGTRKIVNSALKNNVKKFCFVSSIAALGNVAEGFINEDVNGNPEEKILFYSITKFYSELEVWRAIEEGLNAVIVNPSIILGPVPNNKGFIYDFIRLIEKGFPFYTEGINGYVDVRDVAKVMVLLTENNDIKNQRFIVSAENLSYKQVFELIAKYLGKKAPQKLVSDGVVNFLYYFLKYLSKFTFGLLPDFSPLMFYAKNKYFYSNEKIKSALNYSFLSIDESLRHIISLYKKS